MAEVGRLFNNNELIVAEVLQSAEAMKAAVNHLEQFMEKADTAARGKVILATVKGDVHDIGKNLVEIILANNGYDVVNLGIKVPPDVLIQACQEHKPDAIGLSGLLVKSTQQMVITATDLQGRGHPRAAAGGRRGALREVHPHQDRAGLRRSGLLRQGRHDRPEPDEPPHGPGGARRRAGRRTRSRKRPRRCEAPAEPLGARDHAPQPQSAHRLPIPPAPYLDRQVRDVPQPGRGVELHQSVHALRPAPRLQGQFREGPGGARAEGARTVPQRGGGEAGSRALHEGEGGVAVLRGRARRQRHPPVRARRASPRFTPSTSAGSAAKTGSA